MTEYPVRYQTETATPPRDDEQVMVRLRVSGGRTVMDRISESLLNEFSARHGLTEFNESKRFEHLACYLAVGEHYGETFDTSDLLMGTATGIDAVAIIVNRQLITDLDELLDDLDSKSDLDVEFIFVQADKGPNFDAAKIGQFAYAVNDFFQEKPALQPTDEIADARRIMQAIYDKSPSFRTGNPLCCLYYVTTGQWEGDGTLSARIDSAKSDLERTNLFREVAFAPLGRAEVQALYRRRTTAAETTFTFERKVTLPPVDGVEQAYLGYLPVPELLKIIASPNGDVNGSLFYSNPRDWQGWNSVNNEIRDTLHSNPKKSRFVLMNNGITILASKIRSTGDTFTLTDYQIVNGCQTSHALSECAEAADTSVAVPVRVIETNDDAIKNDIIRATNRQTAVPEDQFFALSEFPKQLEEYFCTYTGHKAIYYERRSRQYDRRAEIEKTRVITQPNVIRAFAAMFLPDEAHRTTKNFRSLKAKVQAGREIFSKDHKPMPYYTAAYALYKLEYLFRSGKLSREFKPARFHILLAARLLGNPEQMPQLQSRQIDRYCQPILEALWMTSDELLLLAADVVARAVDNNFDRDVIRTERTTASVTEACARENAQARSTA